MQNESLEPRYVISIAAKILGLHAQTLRYYERVGVLQPSRSVGRIRLYSDRDIERIRQIQRLMSDLGVNLAGVEVILRMRNRIAELEEQVEALSAELDLLHRMRSMETT